MRRTFVGQPFLAADLDVFAARLAPRFFGLPVRAEFLVQADLVTKFAEDDFRVDRIVEKPEAGNVVGYQVFGVAEIGQRAQHVPALVFRQVPFLVVDHLDHDAELRHAGRDEFGQLGVARLAKQVARRLLDMFGRGIVFHRRPRLVHDGLETRQVVVAESKRDIEGHAGVRVTSAYPKPPEPNIKVGRGCLFNA